MLSGFCAETVAGQSDCVAGGSGSRTLTASELVSWSAAHSACTAVCSRCARCRYISFSLKWKDCSWFHECDTSALQNHIEGFRTVASDRAPPTRGDAELDQEVLSPIISAWQTEDKKVTAHGASGKVAPLARAAHRVALCLHGKLFDWNHAAKDNASLASFATFIHTAMSAHMIEPNRQAGMSVDVFIHSWSPEIGRVFDELYRPIRSLHQPAIHTLDKVRSQHLSLSRSLQLLFASEQRVMSTTQLRSARMRDGRGDGVHGFRGSNVYGAADARGEGGSAHGRGAISAYELVVVARHDVLFFSDLLLHRLPGREGTNLWLPHHCIPVVGETRAETRAIAAHCQSDRGSLYGPPYTARYSSDALPRLGHGANYNTFVLDYWLVAVPRVAETFGRIHTQHERYVREFRQAHGGWTPYWSHYFWAFHVSGLLAAGAARLAFASHHEIHFNLARMWHFGTDCVVPSTPALLSRLSAKLEQQRVRLSSPSPYVGYSAPGASSAAHDGHDHSGARLARANISWMADQCPYTLRVGLAVHCPWYSPRCSPAVRQRVGRILEAGQRLSGRRLRLPRPLVHGNDSSAAHDESA